MPPPRADILSSDSARVAELADAQDLKSCDLTVVWVQVPPRVLRFLLLQLLATEGKFLLVQHLYNSIGFAWHLYRYPMSAPSVLFPVAFFSTENSSGELTSECEDKELSRFLPLWRSVVYQISSDHQQTCCGCSRGSRGGNDSPAEVGEDSNSNGRRCWRFYSVRWSGYEKRKVAEASGASFDVRIL